MRLALVFLLSLCMLLYFTFSPAVCIANTTREDYLPSLVSTMIPFNSQQCPPQIKHFHPAFSSEQRGPKAGGTDGQTKEASNLCTPDVLIPVSQPPVSYGELPKDCACFSFIEAP